MGVSARIKLNVANRWDINCFCGEYGTTLAPMIHELTGIQRTAKASAIVVLSPQWRRIPVP